MLISLIVAMDKNRVIGRDGDLPWRLPNDLRWFKMMTWGKRVVMGRKTYESIGRPLPGRANVVMTRQTGYSAEGCAVVHSAEAALATAEACDEVVIIGGAAVYEAFLPLVTKIYLTEVDAEVEGDTWFPELAADEWKTVSRIRCSADAKHPFPFTFATLHRI